MVVFKATVFRRLHEYSTQILLVLVFFLVLFTFLGNPIRSNVLLHDKVAKDKPANVSKIIMENNTAELRLPYLFAAEDLIKEGRVSKEDFEEIRTFVSNLNDKYVPSRIQDEMIVIFLISCANDVELTKKTIVSYYLLKYQGPEIYDNRDLNNDDIKLALNTIHMSSIPVRTEDNDVYHYFNIHDTSYRNFDIVPIMKVSYMLMDVAQEKNPPNGLIVVIDMKGCGLMHMTRFKLQALKKYLMFLQEGFPMRLKMIHLLNSVYFMDKLLAIIKVFMKSELMSMLQIHPPNLEPEKLYQIIPKKHLPKEYGGDLPSEKELHERTLELFKTKQEFWDIEEKIRKLTYSS